MGPTWPVSGLTRRPGTNAATAARESLSPCRRCHHKVGPHLVLPDDEPVGPERRPREDARLVGLEVFPGAPVAVPDAGSYGTRSPHPTRPLVAPGHGRARPVRPWRRPGRTQPPAAAAPAAAAPPEAAPDGSLGAAAVPPRGPCCCEAHGGAKNHRAGAARSRCRRCEYWCGTRGPAGGGVGDSRRWRPGLTGANAAAVPSPGSGCYGARGPRAPTPRSAQAQRRPRPTPHGRPRRPGGGRRRGLDPRGPGPEAHP